MPSSRWADLLVRSISGAAMIIGLITAFYIGEMAIFVMIAVLTSLLIWELAQITARPVASSPKTSVFLALIAFIGFIWWFKFAGGISMMPLLVLPALIFYLPQSRDKWLAAVFGVLIFLAGLTLARTTPYLLVWLLLVVFSSDIAGYFIGRLVGGPKFWPAISPKKTWSGTVAGWFAALCVTYIFGRWAGASTMLFICAPIVAFCGQMGDIAQSWAKRRAGVKDSSRLIPGHGGVWDRLDAVIGAALALMVMDALLGLGVRL